MAYSVAMETPAALPPDIWDRTPPEAQAYIRSLEARLESVEALEARIHTLQDQIRTLEERLNQTSRNSSRPPSSDPPSSPRPKRPRGKRRRGGQPGHPGQTRRLIPVEDVDEVVPLKPEQCQSCQAPLSGDDPAPFRHQVIEIPPIQPVVTEYQWHQWPCPACGETTRAPWPAGVPSGTYSPRVHATVALCTGAYRLSKRTTGQVMNDLCGVPMRAGTISQAEKATTAVVAEARLAEAPHQHRTSVQPCPVRLWGIHRRNPLPVWRFSLERSKTQRVDVVRVSSMHAPKPVGHRLGVLRRAAPGLHLPRLVKQVGQRRRFEPDLGVTADPFGCEGQHIAVEVAHERADSHLQLVRVAALCHEDYEHGTQEARTALVHAVILLRVPFPGRQQIRFLQQGVQPTIRQVLG